MPSGLRVRGQEVETRVTSNGSLLQTLTAIRSFEATAMLTIQSEGYLGEGSERKDEIFSGMKGTAEWHIEDATALTLMQSIIDRAQRRTPGTQIVVNIMATVTFPDGTAKRLLIRDVAFGEMPVRVASRKDYVVYQVSFESGAALETNDA